MSELDDLLGQDHEQRARQAELGKLSRDHRSGWWAVDTDPAIQSLVSDFLSRIPPDAGIAAYWVSRLARPTVHLAPEDVPLFSGWTREYKAVLKHHAQAMRNEAQGPARLLALEAAQNDAGPKPFPLIRIGEEWVPAGPIGGFPYWSSSSTFDHDDARRVIVSYLRR